nr:hypothetical protein [Tanacetum cinerariifolium]
MEGEDLAASIGLLSDCEKLVPSKVVVDKDDETLVLVFDEALGVEMTLLRRSEEALLMEKIRMDQQRLGVDEMDWVGNERREEEQEEQAEEEDEDDYEVEEGKHGDANVREWFNLVEDVMRVHRYKYYSASTLL